MTSNEIRQIIGMKPSDDPKADELKNSNISEAKSEPSNEGALMSNPVKVILEKITTAS